VSIAAISSTPISSLRSDFTAALGCRISVGTSPLTVSDVGRWKTAGNVLTHTVGLYLQSTGVLVPGGSAVVDLSGGTVGTYVYMPLAAPITLDASTDYYLLSAELNGGDQWYDLEAATTSADLTLDIASYYDGSYHETGPGECYSAPNFLYTIGGGPPIAVLSEFLSSMRRV
jgi:hypothetical protein